MSLTANTTSIFLFFSLLFHDLFWEYREINGESLIVASMIEVQSPLSFLVSFPVSEVRLF